MIDAAFRKAGAPGVVPARRWIVPGPDGAADAVRKAVRRRVGPPGGLVVAGAAVDLQGARQRRAVGRGLHAPPLAEHVADVGGEPGEADEHGEADRRHDETLTPRPGPPAAG